jgi:hypothetical protein
VVRFAENANVLLAILYASAECSLALKADKQDAVLRIFAVVGEMVRDATVLSHT